MANLVRCPLCGFEMGKEIVRYEGFKCPKCGRFLHVDDRFAKMSFWCSIVLGVVLAYLSDFSGFKFVLSAIVFSLSMGLGANFLVGWFWLKLAAGGAPYAKGSLRITPPDDPPAAKGDGRGEKE